MSQPSESIKDVLENNCCVGCGACAYISDTKMNINQYGEYEPASINIVESDKNASLVCPSLTPSLNEDVLAKELYEENTSFSEEIGYFIDCFAANVKDEEKRLMSTSGGMTTWVATEMMRLKLIDGVIHAKQTQRGAIDSPFYEYGISTSIEEVQASSRTKYHVMEVSQILTQLKEKKGRYLFIGVPCLVKTIRRLQKTDEELRQKIAYTISLVCGHFKSINWSLSLNWASGIHPKDSIAIQYRTKDKNIAARSYVFRVSSREETIQRDAATVAGGKYNLGALMLPACEFCDDVIGETADLSIGDAWLPKYEADDNGTNLLVVRNKVLLDLLTNGAKDNKVFLDSLSPKDVYTSQSGGYRQRREGLSHRLLREKKKGNWVPQKRVSPGQYQISYIRKYVYDLRTKVTYTSRQIFLEALARDDFSLYQNKIGTLAGYLRKVEIISSFNRLFVNKINRMIRKGLRARINK